MNKKSIAALAIAATMTLGVGASSYAWFTSSATSSNNVFMTGKLKAGIGSQWKTLQSGNINVNNMQPGDSKTLTVSVNNDSSTLDMKYMLVVTAVAPAVDSTAPNLMDVVRFNYGADKDLTLNDLNTKLAADVKTISGASKATDTREITIVLPTTVDDHYQQGQGRFTVTVKATQTNGEATFNF